MGFATELFNMFRETKGPPPKTTATVQSLDVVAILDGKTEVKFTVHGRAFRCGGSVWDIDGPARLDRWLNDGVKTGFISFPGMDVDVAIGRFTEIRRGEPYEEEVEIDKD